MNQVARRIHIASRIGSLTLCGLMLSNCAMPPKQFIAKVKEDGLVSAINANRTARQEAAATAVAYTGTTPVRERAFSPSPIITPTIVTVPVGEIIQDRPGYVLSPHTSPKRIVDVREFKPGEEVRCPITMKPFIVPDYNAIVEARRQENKDIAGSKTDSGTKKNNEVASTKPSEIEVTDLEPATTRVKDLPPIKEESDVKPGPVKEVAEQDLPFGRRVPSQAGVVYSPYAGEGQLVDVAGIAPGAMVRCPWTQKLFRVPELTPEELGSAPAEKKAPDSKPEAAPAPSTEAPAPSTVAEDKPKEPAPAPAPAPESAPKDASIPTAEWADKEKGQVKSPYGAKGVINVKNMAPGTKAQDPFTGKPFIVPNP